ncbi:arginine--tRNA ligase [Helcobacillus massiliensis]|uniref:arginine--tRNA ligase domain-containing protein n=1 Tax=Helcobacillus massiliensis TaxID=521392 RepID=UPI003CCDA364
MSKQYFHRIYSTLDVTLTDNDLAGESSYNDLLQQTCDDLKDAGIARVSDGALCVFPDGFTGRDEQPLPLIIQKSDGGFGYATTDLAAIRHRVRTLGATRIAYVVGTAQELHFQMIFQTAREAGWLPESVDAQHVKIGSVLGEDGKILRTRSGSSLRLMDLLQEGTAKARGVIDELRPDLPEDEREQIAQMIGIGGIKYADLSTAHDSDYTFDLDRCSPCRATPRRTCSTRWRGSARSVAAPLRRRGPTGPPLTAPPLTAPPRQLRHPAWSMTPSAPSPSSCWSSGRRRPPVAADYAPHRMAAYLFDLAQAFMGFYEHCPILKEEDAEVRTGRLALADLTESVLRDRSGPAGRQRPGAHVNLAVIGIATAGLLALFTWRFHHALTQMSGGRRFDGGEFLRSIGMITALLVYVLIVTLLGGATMGVVLLCMMGSLAASIGLAWVLASRG